MAFLVLYEISGQGIPSWFGVIHPKRRTPIRATLVLGRIVAILALSGSVGQLVRLTSSVTLTIFLLVNGASLAVHLRDFQSGSGRPLRPIPAIGVASLAILLCLGLLGFGLLRRWVRPRFASHAVPYPLDCRRVFHGPKPTTHFTPRLPHRHRPWCHPVSTQRRHSRDDTRKPRCLDLSGAPRST